MAEIFGVENTLDNFRIFEVVGATTDLDTSLVGGVLDLTNNVRGINADGISEVVVNAAATGVNGQHIVDFAAAALTLDELKVVTVDYSDLDLGQTIPFTFRFKVSSTTAATQASALATQIQGDPRYSTAPFTIAAVGNTVVFTDAPKGDLLAGEVTANEILTDVVGATVTLNNVARVQPFGQYAQLKRIQDASGNSVNPGIAPNTRFVGTLSASAVYTTISVTYRLDTKQANPVSEAAHKLYTDVMYVDEANTNFAYISSAIQHLASLAGNLAGVAVAMLKGNTNVAGSSIPVGAGAIAVAAGGAAQDVYILAGNPVGTTFTIDNAVANITDVNANTVAGETIDSLNTVAVGATSIATIRKVSSSNWTVV